MRHFANALHTKCGYKSRHAKQILVACVHPHRHDKRRDHSDIAPRARSHASAVSARRQTLYRSTSGARDHSATHISNRDSSGPHHWPRLGIAVSASRGARSQSHSPRRGLHRGRHGAGIHARFSRVGKRIHHVQIHHGQNQRSVFTRAWQSRCDQRLSYSWRSNFRRSVSAKIWSTAIHGGT